MLTEKGRALARVIYKQTGGGGVLIQLHFLRRDHLLVCAVSVTDRCNAHHHHQLN